MTEIFSRLGGIFHLVNMLTDALLSIQAHERRQVEVKTVSALEGSQKKSAKIKMDAQGRRSRESRGARAPPT